MFKHIFLPWLMPMFGLSFAAGADVLAGPTEGAVVADAVTTDDTADATTDGAVTDPVDETLDPDAATTDADAEKEPAIAAATQPIDGRQVPAAVRKHLADLKATNPQLAKEINDYVWGYKNLKADITKNFPGGLKEAVELKTTVDELLGADSVDQFKEEVQQYRNLDQQFINGDPEFIRTAVAQFPDGFKKLMPSMLDTWAQVDGDSYDRRMAGIVVATLHQNHFSTNESRSVDFLEMADPDKSNPMIQKAIALLTANQKALTGWNDFASKPAPVPAVDPNAQKNAEAARQLDDRETKLFLKGVAGDFDQFHKTKVDAGLTSLKAKAMTPEARAIFDQQVRLEIRKKLDAEPNFAAKYGALINARDHAGAIKLLTSRSDAHFHSAVVQVYKYLYDEPKLGAKKAVVTDKGKAGVTAPAAPKGFVKIEANFNPKLIDRSKTSDSDIAFHKKAVLTDGRKVYWGEKVPTA